MNKIWFVGPGSASQAPKCCKHMWIIRNTCESAKSAYSHICYVIFRLCSLRFHIIFILSSSVFTKWLLLYGFWRHILGMGDLGYHTNPRLCSPNFAVMLWTGCRSCWSRQRGPVVASWVSLVPLRASWVSFKDCGMDGTPSPGIYENTKKYW